MEHQSAVLTAASARGLSAVGPVVGREDGMKRFSCWLLLLCLPLVLTACAGSKQLLAEKDAEIARLKAELEGRESARAGQLDADLKKALADLEAERMLRVEGNRIIMPNAVLFASGSVTITDEGKRVLDETWNAIAKYSDRDILIEGHTDNVPIAQKYQGKYKSNWELSTARSLAVLHYLRAKKGAKPEHFGALGYGEYRPVADNSSEEGRRRNRRVVLVISRLS